MGAITKREQDGIVIINTDQCIGCRYCVWACPFGAPQFNAAKNITEKCTLCVHRVEQGLRPACVDTCPAKVRFFGELQQLSMMMREKRAQQAHLGIAGGSPSVMYTKPF